jgi:IS30 family transposase
MCERFWTLPELLRNRLPSGRYSPLHAAGAYQLRRRREALIERDRALRTFVVDRLIPHVARLPMAAAADGHSHPEGNKGGD